MCLICAISDPKNPLASYDQHLDGTAPTLLADDSTPVVSADGSGDSSVVSAEFTWDQIADYLTDGYWAFVSQNSRAFDLSGGRVLTYDISGLSADAQIIAATALEAWSAVTGITFTEIVPPAVTIVDEGATDAPPNQTSTRVISVNTEFRGNLASVGDRDAVRVALTAGQTYNISLEATGISALDSFLRVLDAAGNQVAFNDDGGAGLNSQLNFTATTTGNYYLVAGSFNDEDTGTYALTITEGSGAQILFDDEDPDGAYASSDLSGNTILSSAINIPDNWDLHNLNGYMLMTYIHEIGHALGLGHAGPYNGSATWGVHNLYDNDSWSATVMSYFSQDENPNVAGDYAYLASTMPADIIAIQNLYGTTSTYAGNNTVWGFGSNMGGYLQDLLNMATGHTPIDPFVFAGEPISMTVFDTGGIDTINFSYFTGDQTINLNELTYSSVGGLIDNVIIARGVVIEHAIGGSGNDLLTGNAVANRLDGTAGNDTLSGGQGADTLIGGAGADSLGGGGSVDMASYRTSTTGLYADLANAASNTGDAAGDIYGSIESLEGTGQNDSLLGTNGGNQLKGLGGNDTLNGRDGNDKLFGSLGNDNIYGGVGTDVLYGEEGADKLRGDAGSDYFVFNTALGSGNVDQILDFVSVDDTIKLNSAIFTAAGPGRLSGSEVAFGTTATTADQRIIYDAATGRIYYDEDGNGAAARQHFATVAIGTAIAANDFVVF